MHDCAGKNAFEILTLVVLKWNCPKPPMVGDYRHNSIFDFWTCYYILHCNEFFVFEFYVGFINFLTEFRNFRLIKFSDNLNSLLI